jgi:hypothetical protein
MDSWLGSSSNNTGFGAHVLELLTSGINNSCLGDDACRSLTTGGRNTGVGKDAFELGSAASDGAAFGEGSCDGANTNGDTCVGWHAGLNFTTDSEMTIIGDVADANPITGLTYGSCIGSGCVINTSYTVALGGHIGSHQVGTAVAVTGTGCTLTYGNDNDGKITLSSGATSCVVTFGHSYSQPVATLSASATAIAPVVTTLTTSALTIGVSAASGVVYYSLKDVN